MSNPQLLKLSGMAFIAGSVAFATILSGSDPIAIPGSMLSGVVLAAGLLSLRAGYGETAGRFGRGMLLAGAVGATFWVIALATLMLLSSAGKLTGLTEADGERFWITVFGAPAVALLGLTLFGLSALRTQPMRRLNWLPILAGIWYPAVYSFFFVYLVTHNGKLPDYWPIVVYPVVIQFLALCVLGFTLFIESQKELAAA